jgi:hypothetical protein
MFRAVVVSLRIIVVGGCMIGGGLMGLCMVSVIRSLMKPTMLCGISLQVNCETVDIINMWLCRDAIWKDMNGVSK